EHQELALGQVQGAHHPEDDGEAQAKQYQGGDSEDQADRGDRYLVHAGPTFRVSDPTTVAAGPQNFGVYCVCWFGFAIRSHTCFVSVGSTFSIVLKIVKPFLSLTFARCTVCTT